ncbi:MULTISPECIES: ATP-binding protein [Streptomyces]|uniref:AAA family ATPase n=1 Tax=Streptomyces coelicolor (strain ATCC BAA-471 / A3(2) / M145) TaxID=100226 RepID=Q9L0N2_STRCO|nr:MULTISPECIES: ATP-binding protein [Streptomyces]MYU43781.1 AAA family ATPase [Streptomyces sp. SID7813]MDX2927993.1 ATP-binding protein [Streptomyces sp. NRRL_B-16638]NSL83257.1 ATP-binding protein [Streptomyces coelicolor]QFI44221.1 ATP-binding protein [Streptomyces coelicolor A3(2)]QKN67857.1 ATP-binding protein [Streptomyces coelicolor]
MTTADTRAPAPASTTGTPAAAPPGDSGRALLARLEVLRERVAALVAHRTADDPTADDPLRGLYLPDEAVHHLLRTWPSADADGEPAGAGGPGEPVPGHAPAGLGDRLARLAEQAGLTELDTSALLVALAPDVDRTFEPLYGYLNNDVSRRRATVGLALDLCGVPAHVVAARSRFHASAPLRALGLLEVEEPERPFLTRSLRIPDRLVGHLLGDDTPDAALLGLLLPMPGSLPAAGGDTDVFVRRLAARLKDGPLTAYLREPREGDGLAALATVLDAAGIDALRCTAPEDHVPELLREARLGGRAIVVSGLPEKPGPFVRALTAATDVTVLMTDPRPYDPHWAPADPLVLDAPGRRAGGVAVWRAALGADADGFDLATAVAPYRLGGDRIQRAAHTAQALAAFDGTPVAAEHVRLAARRQSASGLESHARRIRPDVDWQDLVLPHKPLVQLRELALRARHRDRVLGEWRLSAGGGRGRGVLGLFAGESGTGKTLSAEVVAADLGLDLYVVQLSSVVDKYVGETEKNLERIFTEADRTDAVLLFDEADAVFGKRSEVKDAHDKYANMESAYLLQRLESFDGIALLTTNLRANIDEAFTRRLDLVVDFPFPDVEQRLALWRHSLSRVPSSDGIDPGVLARDFELAGGSIRSAVVTAAYLAAGRDDMVTADDLLEGARREYRKAGRLVPGEGGW